MAEDPARALASLFLQDALRFDQAARGLAKSNRSVSIPITGQSMQPAFPPGTLIEVALCDGSACRLGDVVVFREGDQIVAHRVLHRSASHLVTRGDSRVAPDAPVRFDAVLGRVTDPERPMAPKRRRITRVLNAVALRVVVIVLRVSPSPAAWSAHAMRWLERRIGKMIRKAKAAPNA